MPVAVTPYIPTYITVHMGTPTSNAENVTVSFQDYIKNVASSEIYPTWHYSALRANILAQVSFALNRIYTEYYPSRGYNFNITASTAYDQKFIKGRNFFDSVSELVDELFDDYIRRQGYVEPLAARFCNGTTSQCDGLSQWGSEALAQDGHSSVEILKNYYGPDIELVVNAPVQDIQYSYPGAPMRLGDRSGDIRIAQFALNRIAQAYPAIPKISSVDGIFGPETEASVRAFQSIFNLDADGVIGKGTWYAIFRLYSGILQLSELVSEGQTFAQLNFDYNNYQTYGPEEISLLQYLLSILSQFYTTIPFVNIDGIYGEQTRQAVRALQQDAGLPQTGVVDEATWNALVDRFLSIDRTVLSTTDIFPFTAVDHLTPAEIQENLATRPDQFPGRPLEYGQTD